jgi:hypothetical protein
MKRHARDHRIAFVRGASPENLLPNEVPHCIPASAGGATQFARSHLEFIVVRNDEAVGTHVIDFTRDGDTTNVKIAKALPARRAARLDRKWRGGWKCFS